MYIEIQGQEYADGLLECIRLEAYKFKQQNTKYSHQQKGKLLSAEKDTATSSFLMAMAEMMPLHPQFIMDHLGKMRNKKGEPLLYFIMNQSMVHLDTIDALLGVGLPMYEAKTQKNKDNFGDLILFRD